MKTTLIRHAVPLLLALLLLLPLCACTGKEQADPVVRVLALNGPTGMGMAKLNADEKAFEKIADFLWSFKFDEPQRDFSTAIFCRALILSTPLRLNTPPILPSPMSPATSVS